MPLTTQNSSSYACNDLLENEKYEKSKIQFVLESPKVKPSDFPRSANKLSRMIGKIKREFKRYYGVPILLRPLDISVRPSKSTKYLDERGYYLRKYSTYRRNKSSLFIAILDICN